MRSASTVAQLTDAAGRLSKSRRGALMVVDLGSDLRPEDFLNPGITVDAQLAVVYFSTCLRPTRPFTMVQC